MEGVEYKKLYFTVVLSFCQKGIHFKTHTHKHIWCLTLVSAGRGHLVVVFGQDKLLRDRKRKNMTQEKDPCFKMHHDTFVILLPAEGERGSADTP